LRSSDGVDLGHSGVDRAGDLIKVGIIEPRKSKELSLVRKPDHGIKTVLSSGFADKMFTIASV
jgi:hypothetical protein